MPRYRLHWCWFNWPWVSPRQHFFFLQSWRILICSKIEDCLCVSLCQPCWERIVNTALNETYHPEQILSAFSVYCCSHLPSSLEPRRYTYPSDLCSHHSVEAVVCQSWLIQAREGRLCASLSSVHWRKTCWQLKIGHGGSLFTPQKWANMTIQVLFLPRSLPGGLVCITHSLNTGKVLFKDSQCPLILSLPTPNLALGI